MSTLPVVPLRRLLILVSVLGLLGAAAVIALGPSEGRAAVPSGEVDPSKATDPVSLTTKNFATPSGRIACAYDVAQHPIPVVCEVRPQDGDTGFPKVEGAKEPKFCRRDFHAEWGGGVQLSPTGRAQPMCPSGVLVLARHPKVLAYDTRWKRGRYICLSRTDALRCSTLSGTHGFRVDKDLMRVW